MENTLPAMMNGMNQAVQTGQREIVNALGRMRSRQGVKTAALREQSHRPDWDQSNHCLILRAASGSEITRAKEAGGRSYTF